MSAAGDTENCHEIVGRAQGRPMPGAPISFIMGKGKRRCIERALRRWPLMAQVVTALAVAVQVDDQA